MCLACFEAFQCDRSAIVIDHHMPVHVILFSVEQALYDNAHYGRKCNNRLVFLLIPKRYFMLMSGAVCFTSSSTRCGMPKSEKMLVYIGAALINIRSGCAG